MAASYYNVINDFLELSQRTQPSLVDSVTTNPYWILTIIRFKHPLLFSRKNMLNNPNGGFISSDAVDIKDQILIITSDCIQLQIQNDKSNHIMGLNAILMPGKINYLSEILPGDWILAHIMNNRKTFLDIIKRIKELNSERPINFFKHGFKFIGRVNSIGKTLIQDPNGIKTVRYQLQAHGFKELDSILFYEPHLYEQVPTIGEYLTRIGLEVNKIINTGGGGIDINTIIPSLIDLMLGRGVTKRFSDPANNANLRLATGAAVQNDVPFAYIIPSIILKLLGQEKESEKPAKPIASYADILELMSGIQKYSEGEINKTFIANDRHSGIQSIFQPERFEPMLGIFNPIQPEFTNKPLWTILNQFLNPFINEMFTCLRVNPLGLIMPTLIVRQIPFSTSRASFQDIIGQDPGTGVPLFKLQPTVNINVTNFLELPRWKIHPVLVKTFEVVRTDATRFNFVHIYGQSLANVQGSSMIEQLVRNPPIRDDLDIKRNGLRPFMGTVACHHTDAVLGPKKWLQLCADFWVGHHLTLNGTLSCHGIQAPICPGDNLEFDGVVYHIESILHTCQINPVGLKTWTTALSLSNGMRSDSLLPRTIKLTKEEKLKQGQEIKEMEFAFPNVVIRNPENENVQIISSTTTDINMYPALKPKDNTGHDPGFSSESPVEVEEIVG